MRHRPILISIVASLLGLILVACGPGAPAAVLPTPSASSTQPPATQPAPATQAPAPPAPATAVVQPTTAPPPVATVPPAPTPSPQRISFATGATSGAVDAAVVRGAEQRYVLGARAGQLMRVKVGALEHNAVFTIFDPGGQALAGAEPGRDATDWSGALPTSGDYQIAVGATRGNATFHLEVTITDPAPQAQPIRDADWNAVLANDPALEFTSVEGRPYVAVQGANPGVGGHPLLDSIIYVDMDRDGLEEAAITLNSGGTAGNIGFLIYRQAITEPQLTAWHDGYKLGLAVEAGQLVARNALYAGWEPNCCPSGFSFDTYTLAGQQLSLVAHREEGIAGVQAATVEHFYELLGRKELKAAYALLADAERTVNPYDAWAAGYADTLDIQATATPDPAIPNMVRLELTATDRTADGGQVVRHFAGTWELVWAGAGRGWALVHPNIGATQ